MAETENPNREIILARIRAALQTTAPRTFPEPMNTLVFPPVEDPLARFRQECADNAVDCVLTRSYEESARMLWKMVSSVPAGEIFVQDAPELRSLLRECNERTLRWSSNGPVSEQAQASITLADVLVAVTGSVFVSSSCGGRMGSIVAPVHLVFATTSQIVPDLEVAFARMTQQSIPEKNSFVGLITGSSRTADIEKILVIGAHGPRKLSIVLQED